MKVALVNINRIKPPIAPIGLEYIAEALTAAGHETEILDLAWQDNAESAIEAFFFKCDAPLVGISIRNTDDCAFTTRHSFLRDAASLVQCIRKHTDGFVVLGGAGFSVMPKEILSMTEADAGVWGEGEFVFPELADRIENKLSIDDVPGLCRIDSNNRFIANSPVFGDLSLLPPMKRNCFDNIRYFMRGGQAAVETSRGCNMSCTFCADPVAKGKNVRFRPPEAVADEIGFLLSQGIYCFHTADSEFNLSEEHSVSVCESIIKRGLSEKVQWYAYATPGRFSPNIAKLMKQAGCVGINFSVDHGDSRMLKKLGRSFSPKDILDTAKRCKENNMAVMFDILLGAPGESYDSVLSAVELMKRSEADRVGISLGVRIWPQTALAHDLLSNPNRDGLVGGTDDLSPLFYLEPTIANEIGTKLESLIGDDSRFLFFNPSNSSKNYNYNDNQILSDAVAAGYRGAYWDILRRLDSV